MKSVNQFVADMVILNIRRHESIVQDVVKRKNQYNVRIAVEDGGNVYGGNGFEKGGDGTADHIKMDIDGGADCTGCKGCTDDGRRYGRQTVRDSP